jgi:serine protease inhibitor
MEERFRFNGGLLGDFEGFLQYVQEKAASAWPLYAAREFDTEGIEIQRDDTPFFEKAVSNSAWLFGDETAPPGFEESLARHFGASLQRLGYEGEKGKPAAAINNWHADASRRRNDAAVSNDYPEVTTSAVFLSATNLTRYFYFNFTEATEDAKFYTGKREINGGTATQNKTANIKQT